MRKISASLTLALMVLSVLACVPRACADTQGDAGRAILSKWQTAVITVRLVVKSSVTMDEGEGQKRESKVEATGCIIDPSGLVAMSLSASNPDEAMASMMSAEDMKDMNISSEITDTKIVLNDGTELPARVVLRDKDLDLAFVRPLQAPAAPLPIVDLSKASAPAAFDETVILYRLGPAAARAAAGCLDRIQAVVQKPRTFYVPGLPAYGTSLGAPVFALDSNPVGLLLLRTLPGGSDDSSSPFSGPNASGQLYIVLPAADILEAANQAPK